MPSEKPCPFVNERRKIMLLILLLLFAKACVQNIHDLFNNETKKSCFSLVLVLEIKSYKTGP